MKPINFFCDYFCIFMAFNSKSNKFWIFSNIADLPCEINRSTDFATSSPLRAPVTPVTETQYTNPELCSSTCSHSAIG
jgi:hypothetical protein